ncbi:hypothetical protein EV702DRAFT_1044336 [Suillus placidus]|uniref:Uncharacterized protein n=1 Tax=Suillus placidus TaxID=48579 RepID=A0A9P6ZY76_9AGAM|nr:hypothetical protein EV702DRAFT_1044336 [Suillus placidus]
MWTIVSSCILTLFACIYSAIHPNIPSPEDSPNCILRRRLGIMIMALIAPELIVTWAMRQWFCARRVTRHLKESGYPSVRSKQAREQPEKKESVEAPEQCENPLRFLRLRLVVVAKDVLSVLVFLRHFPGTLAGWVKMSVKAHFSEQSEDDAWTQTHSSFVLMGGFMLYADGKPCLTLRPSYILKLIHEGYIDVPTITAKQIRDRSKGNAISKGLIVLQVAWFVMQLITRAIYQLETTQLEVGTLAFAVLNFLTYAVWWNKPLDVECSHPVYWKSTESRPEDHIDIGEGDRLAELGILAPVFRPIAELMGLPRIPISRKLRVPTFDGSIELEDSDKMVLQLAALLMATIFGSIHCMAWFFAFPTYQEQVLWRMSAVAITFTPWLCFPMNLNSESISEVVMFVYGMIRLVSVMLYITARAVLLVLMFTTLCNLPPDAYKAVSWTSVVPHL